MVSGFLTSPCDHCLMSSAVARPIRSSSKKLTSSKTLPSFRVQTLWFESGPGAGAAAMDDGPGSVSDFFDAARPPRGQVVADPFRRAEEVLVGPAHLVGKPVAGDNFYVEAQRLHLLDQHLERLGDARLGDVLALDDGLVDLHPAQDVVGLDGEQLLQGVGGTVGLEGPHLHLAEPLTAELSLTTERLLGDH